MVIKFEAAAGGDDKKDKKDKDKRKDSKDIVNTTTVSYEDKAGTKYSGTKVRKVGEDEEPDSDSQSMSA